MQTFLPYTNSIKCAGVLDNKRLGKQRVEAIQILQISTGIKKDSQWRNHPAVKMWKGYEPFLLWHYLVAIFTEWKSRGFKNTKCDQHFDIFTSVPILLKDLVAPPWLTDEFCKHHQSNLIRKNHSYYGPLFPGIPDNLPYIWPVK
jgi:hypothetical protein